MRRVLAFLLSGVLLGFAVEKKEEEIGKLIEGVAKSVREGRVKCLREGMNKLIVLEVYSPQYAQVIRGFYFALLSQGIHPCEINKELFDGVMNGKEIGDGGEGSK